MIRLQTLTLVTRWAKFHGLCGQPQLPPGGQLTRGLFSWREFMTPGLTSLCWYAVKTTIQSINPSLEECYTYSKPRFGSLTIQYAQHNDRILIFCIPMFRTWCCHPCQDFTSWLKKRSSSACIYTYIYTYIHLSREIRCLEVSSTIIRCSEADTGFQQGIEPLTFFLPSSLFFPFLSSPPLASAPFPCPFLLPIPPVPFHALDAPLPGRIRRGPFLNPPMMWTAYWMQQTLSKLTACLLHNFMISFLRLFPEARSQPMFILTVVTCGLWNKSPFCIFINAKRLSL
jgi:hypothetical protein